MDAAAQLLTLRRLRRAEQDEWATRQITTLITDTHGSGQRLRDEMGRALQQVVSEVVAAFSATDSTGKTNPEPLDPQRVAGHLANASQALGLADIVATVLTAAVADTRRAAS